MYKRCLKSSITITKVHNINPGFTKQIRTAELIEEIASKWDFVNRLIILHDLRLLLK